MQWPLEYHRYEANLDSATSYWFLLDEDLFTEHRQTRKMAAQLLIPWDEFTAACCAGMNDTHELAARFGCRESLIFTRLSVDDMQDSIR